MTLPAGTGGEESDPGAPRRVHPCLLYTSSGEYESAFPISATFELSDDEADAISARFGEGVLLAKQWTLSVRYDNTRTFDVEIDEARCV